MNLTHTHVSAANGTREIRELFVVHTDRIARVSVHTARSPPINRQTASQPSPSPSLNLTVCRASLLVFTILNDLQSSFESDKNTAYLQLTSKRCTSSNSITFSNVIMGFLLITLMAFYKLSPAALKLRTTTAFVAEKDKL